MITCLELDLGLGLVLIELDLTSVTKLLLSMLESDALNQLKHPAVFVKVKILE